ncbi:hypothetical protein BB560_003690 [Smittium megazygosporum]|uniref:Uncharacterized protein n=1 Tax=Smittium megazygosporum TaxID=133381 RepID=A0A2T9ZBG0_9FUNG|nr:hypothetical protein BB560_003690 [Smittium megazygosporum]
MPENILQIPIKSHKKPSKDFQNKGMSFSISEKGSSDQASFTKASRDSDLESQAIIKYVANRIKFVKRRFHVINIFLMALFVAAIVVVDIIPKSISNRTKIIVSACLLASMVRKRKIRKLMQYEKVIFERRGTKPSTGSFRRGNSRSESTESDNFKYLYSGNSRW